MKKSETTLPMLETLLAQHSNYDFEASDLKVTQPIEEYNPETPMYGIPSNPPLPVYGEPCVVDQEPFHHPDRVRPRVPQITEYQQIAQPEYRQLDDRQHSARRYDRRDERRDDRRNDRRDDRRDDRLDDRRDDRRHDRRDERRDDRADDRRDDRRGEGRRVLNNRDYGYPQRDSRGRRNEPRYDSRGRYQDRSDSSRYERQSSARREVGKPSTLPPVLAKLQGHIRTTSVAPLMLKLRDEDKEDRYCFYCKSECHYSKDCEDSSLRHDALWLYLRQHLGLTRPQLQQEIYTFLYYRDGGCPE